MSILFIVSKYNFIWTINNVVLLNVFIVGFYNFLKLFSIFIIITATVLLDEKLNVLFFFNAIFSKSLFLKWQWFYLNFGFGFRPWWWRWWPRIWPWTRFRRLGLFRLDNFISFLFKIFFRKFYIWLWNIFKNVFTV